MSKRLLILDPGSRYSDKIASALGAREDVEPVFVAHLDDACRELQQNRYSLALIPDSEAPGTAEALRAVQPSLGIVQVAQDTSDDMSPHLARLNGSLPISQIEKTLTTIIDDAAAAGSDDAREGAQAESSREVEPDLALLIAALQDAKLSPLIHTALISKGRDLVAHWGEATAFQSAAAAGQMGQGWENDTAALRLQFERLPGRTADDLLHTRRVYRQFLLTLIAQAETPISELRQQSDPVAAALLEIFTGRKRLRTEEGIDPSDVAAESKSYAIVWSPIELLPSSLHIPLRRALGRLALANACVLKHVAVQAELVHLVVTCPPGRDSAWAAYLFKNGSEATIQQEFNVDASLWETGYYASESGDPLSAAELNIFLEHGGKAQAA